MSKKVTSHVCFSKEGAAREWIPQDTKPKKRKSQDRGQRRSLAGSKQTVPRWMVQRDSMFQMATSQDWDSVTQETDMLKMVSRCCYPPILPFYLRTRYTGGPDPDPNVSMTYLGACTDKRFSLPHKPGHPRSAEDLCRPPQK